MKEIKLLEEQINKLDAKNFDLEAWKQYTIVLLARIFGDNNQKIQQVEKIEYDYSSWSLRDTSGSSAYLETCKKLGKEILQASIDELKAFGLPDLSEPAADHVPIDIILNALEDDLKVSQFRKLKLIINKELSIEEKKKEIKEHLKELQKDDLMNIVLNVLSSNDLTGKF
jgi:hypothetical protein